MGLVESGEFPSRKPLPDRIGAGWMNQDVRNWGTPPSR